MADLRTTFLGHEVKNPIGVSSCDFGGHERLAKRVIEQGIGFLTAKTCHKIDGPHRWPRPFFYSLKKFGPELKDSWVCSQMFHNMPYDQWLETEGPKTLKLCRQNDVLFIASVAGIGTNANSWASLCRDMENMGCDMIELDTGGPHATFGAVESQLDVGAPLALDPIKAAEVTKACVDSVKIPIIFKCTPQCVEQSALSIAVKKAGASGITANNAFYGTWIDHETGTFYGGPYAVGGLMGRSWQLFSLAKLLETTATLKGFPVIGVGGIFTWDDCVRYLMAGSSITGLCSSVYTRGVGVLKDAIEGLDKFMDRKGYKSIDDFRGCVVDDFSYVRDYPREKWMAEISPILPKFELDNCNNCGICEKVCAYGAIKMEEEGPVYDDKLCMGCGWCMGHCPAKEQVITMVRRDTEEVIWTGRGEHAVWCK
jgi:dihydropyrimidine dehydrogenase (NAD+) subunit PreA